MTIQQHTFLVQIGQEGDCNPPLLYGLHSGMLKAFAFVVEYNDLILDLLVRCSGQSSGTSFAVAKIVALNCNYMSH